MNYPDSKYELDSRVCYSCYRSIPKVLSQAYDELSNEDMEILIEEEVTRIERQAVVERVVGVMVLLGVLGGFIAFGFLAGR